MEGKTRSRRLSRRQAGVMVVVFAALGAITFNVMLQDRSPKPAPSPAIASTAPSIPATPPSSAPSGEWSPLEL
jgi:hypothetical protein